MSKVREGYRKGLVSLGWGGFCFFNLSSFRFVVGKMEIILVLFD